MNDFEFNKITYYQSKCEKVGYRYQVGKKGPKLSRVRCYKTIMYEKL